MHLRLLFASGLLGSLLAGCGGNVSTGTGGDGGAGGGSTGTTTASTTSATTGTGTTTVPEDFAACGAPGECTLARAGCCAPCGVPELADFAAVNIGKVAAYEDLLCAEPQPCDDCAPGYNPNLFAYCDTAAGKCVAADARTHAVSACTSEDQCFLRGGTGCCESCDELDAPELTALSTEASPSLPALVCPQDTACPPCAPILPSDVIATCGLDGHCRVLVIDK